MADTYNGWTNYETWVVKVWIDNDEFSQERWTESAREFVRDALENDDAETARETAVSNLADALEGEHDEFAPEVSGVFSDLLTHALGRVEWREIARSMVDDVEVYSAGCNMPGYMPDNPPALFVDVNDARVYISEQMDHEAEARADEIDEGDQYSAETRELEDASLACLKGSGEYGATVAGMHYFVTKV